MKETEKQLLKRDNNKDNRVQREREKMTSDAVFKFLNIVIESKARSWKNNH